MNKIWYLGGILVLAIAFLIAGPLNISFHNNTAKAASALIKADSNIKACGCGAQSQCGGTCQAGSCQCGSSCNMNK